MKDEAEILSLLDCEVPDYSEPEMMDISTSSGMPCSDKSLLDLTLEPFPEISDLEASYKGEKAVTKVDAASAISLYF